MDAIDVLKLVISKLEEIHIPYMVGGSFASSLHGLQRFTQGADVVVLMSQGHVTRFVDAFQGDFYLDRGMIERALNTGTSFNLIHLKSMFKVDFFPLKEEAFEQESFSRRRLEEFEPGANFRAYAETPEDTILSKLIWYKLGGGVSENQWRDVTGILKAQGTRLDLAYLHKWAPEVGVADLLERVLEEAGQISNPGS